MSKKSKYGLQALLTLAENHGQGLIHVKDIAQLKNISMQFLVQIFNLLVKADLVSSVRGKNGGYSLSRPPSEISVLRILEILEGGIDLAENEHGSKNAVNELLKSAEERLRESFDISLEELLLRQKEMNQILEFDI